MEINRKLSLQHSLYEYEIMTAQQLAILHGYKISVIYSKTSSLNKQGLIGKVDVPTIGRGIKAYHLNAKSAKYVAEDRNELSTFKEKDWNTAPSGILNTLLTNQFCCELIRATKDIPGSGLSDWRGSKELFQPYLLAGETKLPPKLNGSAIFYFEGKVRHMYINVLTGNESITVINEMLQQHMNLIQEELGNKANKALFLFMYLGNAGKMILKLWRQIVESAGKKENIPYLAAANYEKLALSGIFSDVWVSSETNQAISLLDMPGHNVKTSTNKDFMGKKHFISLNFNIASVENATDEFDDIGSLDTRESSDLGDKNKLTESNPSNKAEKTGLIEENNQDKTDKKDHVAEKEQSGEGIVWNMN